VSRTLLDFAHLALNACTKRHAAVPAGRAGGSKAPRFADLSLPFTGSLGAFADPFGR
jgi:hypothetical protein